MQIVIDIPEKYLDQNIIDVSVMPVNREIRDVNVEDKYAEFTVLPDNPTNGDMIMAMFPNEGDFKTDFDADWWNVPYEWNILYKGNNKENKL